VRLPVDPHATPYTPPLLADCQAIMREFGVKRATAERIMRACAVKVRPPGARRVFVYREDVVGVLRSWEVRDAA
jgi:hypothetical protein